MENEFSEKLINILLEVSKNLKPIHFWNDYMFWLGLINFIILSITLYFLIQYTRATKKIAQYQITPAIDVNMIYEKSIGKTYFWFSNESNFPGLVYLEIKKNEGKKNEGKKKPVYHPLRIPPKRSMKTATTFSFSPITGEKVTLYVSIKPVLEKSNINFKFEKSYIFSQNQWNEISWSFPDPPFPTI